MFKLKLPHQEQGFALVEVLVAILIMTLFVAISMQAMVIAAVFKARAQEFSEATTWIQEDLENVKYQAANFQYTSLSANAANGASSITVASLNDLAATNKLKVGSDTGTYTIGVIAGNTLPITPALGTAQFRGAVVVGTTRCNAGSVDTGFADGLRDKIIGSNRTTGTPYSEPAVLKISKLTKKRFNMTRTTTIPDTEPYNVLQINYDVTPESGGSSVASFYTEVIPNAALQCPPK